MNRLNRPDGLINHPQTPLPWRPSQRLKMTQDFYMENAHVKGAREYIRDLKNQYVITDIGVHAVGQAVGYFSIGADVFYGREHTNRDINEVQREFEQETLGLEPLNNRDGLRFYESPAGFGGGTYPIEPFAELVGTDTETFRSILNDKKATRFGNVILHFSNFIVPVMKNDYDTALVVADRVTELSKEGEALLDTALWISDYASETEKD